jgi:hypothetical protein
MSGRMGAKPLRICLLESFRPSTSSSNECLTTREDHESPASPAHIPPWSGDRELRGRDFGGEWWALMDRRSHPARRQWPRAGRLRGLGARAAGGFATTGGQLPGSAVDADRRRTRRVAPHRSTVPARTGAATPSGRSKGANRSYRPRPAPYGVGAGQPLRRMRGAAGARLWSLR